jgi:hypothetical protein
MDSISMVRDDVHFISLTGAALQVRFIIISQ